MPGIGPSIAAHLDEIFKTGKSRHFEAVMKGLPKAMFDLMEIPGIGAKRAYRLTKELKIGSVAELEKAVKEGRIAKLEGFGEESQAEILKSIEDTKAKSKEKRHLLPYAEDIAHEIIEWMKREKLVARVDPLGSLRRKASTVGDIDLSAATKNPAKVIEHFTKYPNKKRVLEKGTRTASITLPSGVQVDLMVETPDAYGALLQHFTGSKHHNIALRNYALKKGLSLSDYGIKKKGTEDYLKFKDEESFYRFIGMDYIPPELREDTGEIEAAIDHKLPKLVELEDIKADLQIHSSFDIETSHDLGESSMEEIIQKASNLGYEYIAFTEHNPSRSKHNDQQIIDILKRKREVVDKINYELQNRSAHLRETSARHSEKIDQINYSLINMNKKNIQKARPQATGALATVGRVFNSLEIDIMPDGRLPVPEDGMKTLDFALISIHGSFRLSKDKMTERVLKAFDHPKVKIFAHPTGRKLGHREGVELDWPKIFDFCKKNNKWLEINADPMRLDLPDVLVREAVKLGVKLTLGTDSHHKDSMENMNYGVSVARRGWAGKDNIVNTRSLVEFLELLKG
ncbi:DNA polymerase III [Candidatus Woesebacteria bacterium]|nr:DNA polymerase III [Candidatus Woesebacteria bacterium]